MHCRLPCRLTRARAGGRDTWVRGPGVRRSRVRERRLSAAVAALELLARAARARVVAAHLSSAEGGLQRGQRLRGRRSLSGVAGCADAVELAPIVLVERQYQLHRLGLDRPRRGARHETEALEQRVALLLAKAVPVDRDVQPRGRHEAEALPALAALVVARCRQLLPERPARRRAARERLERPAQLERQPRGPAGVDQAHADSVASEPFGSQARAFPIHLVQDSGTLVHVQALLANPLYDARFEHDACGLGLIARADGMRSRELVERALAMLAAMEHRGARGADPD